MAAGFSGDGHTSSGQSSSASSPTKGQDLVVMRSALGALWHELEEQMDLYDWQRTR
jgi:hypothetical protein